MSKIEAKVEYHGKSYDLIWQDGRLSGDAEIADRLQIYANARELKEVGNGGLPSTYKDHIKNPSSFLTLLRKLVDKCEIVYSDVQPVESEEGVIY